jgi:hypothetical protein
MRSHTQWAASVVTTLAALVFPLSVAAGPFTANGTQPGLAHPISASANCMFCHGTYDAAHHLEPGETWQGSMMAQAGRDPLFWGALDVANHDLPSVGEWCLRCHAPAAFLGGRAGPPAGSPDGCTLQGKLDQPDTDFDGVTCHLCHRMVVNQTPPPGQATRYFENAQWWLDDTDCGGQGEPCRQGPYSYPTDGIFAPLHPWQFSSYVETSELCATCHNVTSPAHNLLVAGVDTGIRFPIERTYREWQESDFGFGPIVPGPEFTECQGCHMPDAGVNPAFASSFGINNHAGDLPIHQFAGGNAWVPDVLRQAYPALGIDASLTLTRDFALDQLQHQSATMTVAVPPLVVPGDTMPVSVTVTNLTGHKLPTGYPEGRRMWLHVEARDAANTLLWESGAYDPSSGVLTRDTQAKVYEARQGVWDAGSATCVTESSGSELFHFVKNDCVALDNRIPPKGFTGGADPQTNPVAYAYPETAPGSGTLAHWDVTSYAIPVPPSALSPVTVTATLRYQTTSKEYVDFLLDEALANSFPDDCLERSTGFPGKPRAAVLFDYWTAYDRSPPVDMASAQGSTPVASVDPFLCYRARPTKGSAPFGRVLGIGLADRFGTASDDARKPVALCAPADAGGGLTDATTHLASYQIATSHGSSAPPVQPARTITDRFGTLTLDAIRRVELLVPAARGTGLPPPDPGSHGVDTFACYKVKRSSGAPALPRGLEMTVSTGLTTPAKRFTVKSVARLCLAADRDGTGYQNPAAALMCYRVKAAKGEPHFTPATGEPVNDVLGPLVLDAIGESTLCVPATVVP